MLSINPHRFKSLIEAEMPFVMGFLGKKRYFVLITIYYFLCILVIIYKNIEEYSNSKTGYLHYFFLIVFFQTFLLSALVIKFKERLLNYLSEKFLDNISSKPL